MSPLKTKHARINSMKGSLLLTTPERGRLATLVASRPRGNAQVVGAVPRRLWTPSPACRPRCGGRPDCDLRIACPGRTGSQYNILQAAAASSDSSEAFNDPWPRGLATSYDHRCGVLK